MLNLNLLSFKCGIFILVFIFRVNVQNKIQSAGLKNLKELDRYIKLYDDYIKSDTDNDLIFSVDYTTKERCELQR